MPPIVLFHGPDAAPAQALALACAVTEGARPYDPGAVDQGRLCVLVWADPTSTIAQCLRSGADLATAAAEWIRFARDILTRAESGAMAKLVLVEAQALYAVDWSPLGQALPLVQPLPASTPAAPRDSAAVLAALILPHLPGLHQAWQGLRAVSHCGDAAPLALSELASLASEVRDLDKSRIEPDPRIADAPQAFQLSAAALTDEVLLLREHLAYLQTELGLGPASRPATGIEAATGPLEAAIAALLTDLVAETDRRIQAERDTHQALATLRGFGLEPNSMPLRQPAAPRRAE